MIKLSYIMVTGLFLSQASWALSVPMNQVNGDKPLSIGEIELTDVKCGVLITPKLHDLTPGLHGFHLHENPSCEDHGNAAGGHFDPKKTDKHLGPYNEHGHMGDLPALFVKPDGSSDLPILAKKMKVGDFVGHSLVIHVGSDNYSDTPAKLGGGGARFACGVISETTKKSAS
jgi:superoxide dismutase, Cu-Zn family